MKFLCTLVLSAAYLTLAPIMTVETARSLHEPVAASTAQKTSTHYKTHLSNWNLDAGAGQG